MHRTLLSAAVIAALVFSATAHAAEFTYHGNLQDAGKPAEGKYDLELTLYSAQTGGSVIGGPLTMYAVPVHEGSFSTEADFGPMSKSSAQAYVAVKVRSAGNGDYAALDARSSVTPDTNTSCPGSWSLDGNAGNPIGTYLGTADSQPLVFKTGGTQAARAVVSSNGPVPTWIGGIYNLYSGQGGFVGGGGGTTPTDGTNAHIVGTFGVVGGGQDNVAGNSTITYASILGGAHNRATGVGSTIGGGIKNTASGIAAVVAGGGSTSAVCGLNQDSSCFNTASGDYSFIGGGRGNMVTAKGGTIGGGEGNSAMTDNSFFLDSTVAGGFSNIANKGGAVGGGLNNEATGSSSVVAGGLNNEAADIYTTVGGGANNIAAGSYSTVPGGYANLAGGGGSFAGGVYARVRIAGTVPATIPAGLFASDYTGTNFPDSGTFVWADGTAFSQKFISNGENKFMVLATGGVNFVTARSGSTSTGVMLAPGGGSWSSISDRNVKTDLQFIDSGSILEGVVELPISTWRYISQDRSIRHIGPMAQDFYAAFQVGEDERHITQIDEGGVALAAIQGLNQKLETENADLRIQMEQLTIRLSKLEAGIGK